MLTYKYKGIEGEFAPKETTKIEFDPYVTTIGDKAFYKCSLLERIEIPSPVDTIGDIAFFGYKSLKSINVKLLRTLLVYKL